jgi:hypothetical protein
VGHRVGPLDYVPHHLCGWQHRWDDPRREYRTLYCAESALTCLREVLADLRPNAKAIAELKEMFGHDTRALDGVGEIAAEWRDAHRLCPALAVSAYEFCHLDADVDLRNDLEHELAELLTEHHMEHLDVAQVRSRDRIVTQTVSRELFERSYAGVRFGSNLDNQPCYALFEGRAELEPNGEALELTSELPLLQQVCEEFGLRLV